MFMSVSNWTERLADVALMSVAIAVAAVVIGAVMAWIDIRFFGGRL